MQAAAEEREQRIYEAGRAKGNDEGFEAGVEVGIVENRSGVRRLPKG